jgi:hypothetical protein
VVNVDGNMMVGANTGDATAVLRLGPLAVNEGQQATLFFRVYQTGDEAEMAKGMVALTDRNVRFGSDVGAAGNDIGPGAIVSNEQGYGLQLGGASGNGAPVDFFEPILSFMTVYNVWVDIKNGPFPEDQSSTGDTYSIYVAKNGTAQRTPILTDYISARGQGQADIGFATKDLDKLIIGGLNGTSTTTNLFLDDIYLSKSGFNSTVPRAFGFTTPVSGEPPTLSIAAAAGQVQITWSAGTLQSAATITGTWTDVSGAASPYQVSPEGTQKFYRVKQ